MSRASARCSSNRSAGAARRSDALSADGLGRAILLVNDVPLLALAAITYPGLAVAVWRHNVGPGVVLALALLVAFALSFALQPSIQGIQVVGRAIGLLGLAAGIAALPPRFTRPIVVIVCAVAIGQTVLAVAQIVT